MPELKWNEHEVIECLGVLPEIEYYETGHHFKVEKDGLTLVLSIWQYDSLFEISLYQFGKDSPFINFHLYVRDEVKFINDKRGYYLSFQDCAFVSSEYPLASINFTSDERFKNLTMELAVEPQIKIKFI